MASKRCPACGLVNPQVAERCDCGRSFVDGSQGQTLDERLAKRASHNPEAAAARRTARGLILAAGIIIFATDELGVQVLLGDYLPADWRVKLFIGDAVILGFFVAMFSVAKTRPLAGSIGALAGFLGFNLLFAMIDPSTLLLGIVFKVIYTLLLIGAVVAGNRAQRLLAS